MKRIIAIIVPFIPMVLFTSCGLDVNSTSSCTSQLCKGSWAQDDNGSLSGTLYGTFTFQPDGTCYNICPSGRKIPGTWKLGDVSGVFRDINLSMSESLTNIGGPNIQIQIMKSDNGAVYIDLPNSRTAGDGILSHFN